MWRQIDLPWMLVATLPPHALTGNACGLRGLVFRVAGSWGREPRTSLVLGTRRDLIAAPIVVWLQTRHNGPVTTSPVDWRPHDWQRLSGLAGRPGFPAGSAR